MSECTINGKAAPMADCQALNRHLEILALSGDEDYAALKKPVGIIKPVQQMDIREFDADLVKKYFGVIKKGVLHVREPLTNGVGTVSTILSRHGIRSQSVLQNQTD